MSVFLIRKVALNYRDTTFFIDIIPQILTILFIILTGRLHGDVYGIVMKCFCLIGLSILSKSVLLTG